ncbi:hypothetical protein C1H46_018561 [Malus baccata]|uniref:Uncharacterized protein n=1 Tax=Malus baccata TaxID=106549 RepID=A0A540MBF7_MALBA|nr:hypothetical protein C1H46_018561 [Malus baccata]
MEPVGMELVASALSVDVNAGDMVGICATPPAVWVLSSTDKIHPGCFDRGLACKVAAEVVKAGTGVTDSATFIPHALQMRI